MTEATIKLPYGSKFRDKHCQSAVLTSPMGRGLLLLDQHRKTPVTYLFELVCMSTASIGGIPVKPIGEGLEQIREFWRGCTLDDLQVAGKACAVSVWGDEDIADKVIQVGICLSCKSVNEYIVPLDEIKVADKMFPNELKYTMKRPWVVFQEEVKTILIHPFTVKDGMLLESYLESPIEYQFRMMARMIVTGEGNKPEKDDIANMHTIDRKNIEKLMGQFDAINTLFERNCKKCGAPVKGSVDITSFF